MAHAVSSQGGIRPMGQASWRYFMFDSSLILSPATMKLPLPR